MGPSYIPPGGCGGSSSLVLEASQVYEHALKFQRPSTIKYRHELKNSVSLIGRVIRPLKSDRFGAHNVLRVLGASHPDRGFRILLKMWGCMAEECLNHVKENDLIYVNGLLRSYDGKGVEHIIFYEVNVTEINYVAPVIGQECSGKIGNSLMRGEDATERWRSVLHLWQVFLANPYEWTDLRKTKKNPRQPDFKHKSIGEALWLSRRDPSWLRRQLEKLDSEMEDRVAEEKTPYLAGYFL